MAMSNSRHQDRLPVGVGELGHLGHVVERLPALGVVPGPHHLVALQRGVRARPGPCGDVRATAVGDLGARPGFAVEAPPVERAADALALDPAADGQVGAEMGTVGVEQAGPPSSVRNSTRSWPRRTGPAPHRRPARRCGRR